MKLVLVMGCSWKFSRNSWKNFLTMWKELGSIPNIEKYATRESMVTPNITDWDLDEVEDALSEISKS